MELLREKWISILFHVQNKHSWTGCKKFKKCAHPRLTKKQKKAKEWISPKSEAFKVSNLKQAKTKDGEDQFHVLSSKITNTWTAKPIKEEKDRTYLHNMVCETVQLAREKDSTFTYSSKAPKKCCHDTTTRQKRSN